MKIKIEIEVPEGINCYNSIESIKCNHLILSRKGNFYCTIFSKNCIEDKKINLDTGFIEVLSEKYRVSKPQICLDMCKRITSW